MEIGIDIEDISRFKNKNIRFLERIFTKNELDYCLKNVNPEKNLCARFCAKEAVIKALANIYDKTVSYNNIEILKKENKAPYVNILIDDLKKYNFSLSISHEKEKAIAFVIINEGE